MIAVPEDVFFIISMFDGEHTVLDIQTEYTRRFGELLFSDKVRQIIAEMDENYLLESERFEARKRQVVAQFKRARVRQAMHAGTGYEATPQRLRTQLDSFFAPPAGPGKPAPLPGAKPVKGIVAPHIDLLRGGTCYAWAYHALAQACEAEVFVILGTVHVPTKNLFTLTRKGFKTPLGTMKVDRAFVDALAQRCGERLFEDEYAHKIEHAIEFQVIFLQHMLGKKRQVRIVPVLCSSILESAKQGEPMGVAEVRDFIAALKDIVNSLGNRVCLVASADLAHVGPRFGDSQSLTSARLSVVEHEDRSMLAHAERLDAEAFYRSIAQDGDSRHICGLSPIFVLLKTVAATEGKLLKYAQAPDPSGQGCVSFAAMAFY